MSRAFPQPVSSGTLLSLAYIDSFSRQTLTGLATYLPNSELEEFQLSLVAATLASVVPARRMTEEIRPVSSQPSQLHVLL